MFTVYLKRFFSPFLTAAFPFKFLMYNRELSKRLAQKLSTTENSNLVSFNLTVNVKNLILCMEIPHSRSHVLRKNKLRAELSSLPIRGMPVKFRCYFCAHRANFIGIFNSSGENL